MPPELVLDNLLVTIHSATLPRTRITVRLGHANGFPDDFGGGLLGAGGPDDSPWAGAEKPPPEKGSLKDMLPAWLDPCCA